MVEAVNGGGGIAVKGREREYAEELWLADPAAFWLHPEGPLSETTPDEWRAKQKADREAKAIEQRQQPYNLYANVFANPYMAFQYSSMLAGQRQNNAYRQSLLGSLLG